MLRALVAAQEPPTRAELGRITGLDEEDDLPLILSRLSSFVNVRREKYSLFHRSLFEWLTTVINDKAVAGPYHASLVSGHKRWADWCCSEYRKRDGAPRGYALAHLCTHLAGARRWDELVDVLCHWRFLEARVETDDSSVFDLQSDFALAVARVPADHPGARLLSLLAEILRFYAEFISRHPETLFQCCWNRGWWHDAPAAAFFWKLGENGEADALAPWERKGSKLCTLMETWRAGKQAAQPGFAWLRAARPVAEPLGSTQTAVLRSKGDLAGKVDVSPDSSRVLVVNVEDDPFFVKVWDTETGAPVAERYFGERMLCGALFSASDTIAVGFEDGLALLDSEGLEDIAALDLEGADLHQIACSPDGRLVAIGDGDGRVGIVDVAPLGLRDLAAGHAAWVEALAFSPDGSLLASGCRGFGDANTVILWRVGAELEKVRQFESGAAICSIVFSPDGGTLAWGAYDGKIELLDLATGQISALHEPHGRPAEAVAFLPDGTRLACGGGGAQGRAPISILNVANGAAERVLWGHLFGVSDMVVYRDGRALASAGDSTVRLWSLENVDHSTELVPLEPDVGCICFAPDRDVLFSADEGSELVWCRSLDDGEPLLRLAGNAGGVHALACSTDGKLLASATGSGRVHIWNGVTGEALHVCTLHEGVVTDLALSMDGQRLASAGKDGSVHLVDTATGRLLATFDGHGDDWLQVVAFSPDGLLVASSGLRSTLVWDTRTEGDFVKLGGSNYALAFTPDSRVLLAREAYRLSAWDVAIGAEIEATQEHWEAFQRSRGEPLGPWGWEGENRGPGRGPVEQRYMTLVSLDGNRPIARLPIVGGAIRGAPSGRTWTNRRGTQLWVFRLEGDKVR